MPELPEVESYRRGIEAAALGQRITRVELRRRDMLVVPGDPAGGFARQRERVAPKRYRREHLLLGGTVEAVRRHGKQIAVVTDDHRTLLMQMGMSGLVRVRDSGDRNNPRPPHTHAVWQLGDGRELVFADARRFGLLRALPAGKPVETVWASLGPDALTIHADELAERLAPAHRPIKAALLDQGVIAGIGNIYADEALHRAGIHPLRLAAELASEAGTIAREIRAVLSEAVLAGGSTINSYATSTGEPGSYQLRHRVYGRSGQPCQRCGGLVTSALIAQRTTAWCPRCQPEPEG